jgi:hypothetical protein
MELTDENIDSFRQDVTYYSNLKQLILTTKNEMKIVARPYKEKIDKLTLEKNDLEKQICCIMEKNDLKKAELPDNRGVLKYQIKSVLVPIKQNDIKEKLIKFFESGPGANLGFNGLSKIDKGTYIFNYLYAKENREKTTKESIKSSNS